ncbi:MAG: hypothetical protein K8F91_07505, partial [Candidatus Obscuribacterales bacterium]|nr:hypothetical protein [Candidatus Obscuribacterales bacterium]
ETRQRRRLPVFPPGVRTPIALLFLRSAQSTAHIIAPLKTNRQGGEASPGHSILRTRATM